MEPVWVTAVKQLCNVLQQGEARINLLRKIDRATADIASNRMTLEELLSWLLEALVGSLGASNGHFYVVSGDDLILANTTSFESVPSHFSRSLLIDLGMPWKKHTVFCPSETESAGQLETLFSTKNLLLASVFPSEEDDFGILVLDSNNPDVASPFKDKSAQNLVSTVADQLSNSILFCLQIARNNTMLDLIDSFFEENLKPSKCLKIFAHQASKFLPSFGPLRIEPEPQVQILFYDEGKDYLSIRATTGTEPDITRVQVEKSVCGMLVDDRNLPYLLCDPRESPYNKRYKSYLGKRQRPIQTELAIPITSEQKLIAIINLESEHPNAFRQRHLDAMLRFSQEITPLIAALKERKEAGWAHQRALGTALDNYFDHIGRILRHGTATPATNIRISLDTIQERIGQKDKWLEGHIVKVRRNFDAILNFIEKYRDDVVGFSKYDNYSIRELITDAMKPLGVRELNKQNILVKFKKGPDFRVFCTPLLKQHLYNILNNAVYSVKKRIEKGDDRPGSIVITVQEHSEADRTKEKLYNIRCLVTIWDNGEGVPKDVLNELRLFKYGFTTKKAEGGSGFGLYAARQYLTNINGWIDLDSREGEYFEVRILLDIFNPAIHGKTTL